MTGPIGEPSYNEGLIGNGPPVGLDSYNRGLIGEATSGISPYNEGTIGSASAGINAYNEGTIGNATAGINAYNEGTTGNANAGIDAYNRGNVGSQPKYASSYNQKNVGEVTKYPSSRTVNLVGKAPNYADSYNRTLAGTVPKYPSPYNNNLVGSAPKYPESYNQGTVGNDSPSYPDPYNRGRKGGATINSGSKPKALHTEYATKEADWDAAYRGDLVFYLVRADEGGAKDKDFDSDATEAEDKCAWDPNNPGGAPQSTPPQPDAGNVVPANAQAGPNAPAVQTAPQQVAASASTGFSSAGPAGPQTGMNRSTTTTSSQSASGRSAAGQGPTQTRSLEVPVGAVTQASARYSSLGQSAANITQAVNSLSVNEIVRSYPSSEIFFTDLLYSSFNPGVQRSATRSPQEIEVALASPKISDLSVRLAYASGGIRSSLNLIQGINRGDLGLVTPKTMSQAERFGPQVANTRYTR